MSGVGPAFHGWGVRHPHVQTARRKLIQHLSEPVLSCLLTPCPHDPGQIVVLLVRRALLVRLHDPSFFQRVRDEAGHRDDGALQCRIIRHGNGGDVSKGTVSCHDDTHGWLSL